MLDYFEIFKDVRDASTLTDGQKKKLEENEFFLFNTTEVDQLNPKSFIYNLQDIPPVKEKAMTFMQWHDILLL